MDDLQSAFEKFEDLLTEVTIRDFKGKEEKSIFLSTKTVRNMIDAVSDHLSKSSKPSQADSEKAKGILVNSIKTTSSTLARIRELDDISDPMQLVKSALSFALKKQSSLLEKLK